MKFINRFFNDSAILNGRLTITGDEVHHIKNVLKMKENEQVLCVNNSVQYLLSISELNKESIIFNVISEYENNSESDYDITLFQSTPKGDKADFIIEKATEAGAKKIVIVNTKRSVARLTEENKKKKQDRFSKIVYGAACQSGRFTIPKTECFCNLDKIDFSSYDLLILCYEDEKETSLKNVLKKNCEKKKIGIFIGPEGGIDETEADYLKKKGFICVSLGKRILRCETAGLYALAQINYELDG